MKPNPRFLIPIVVITGLAVGGWWLDSQRQEERSRVSGTFESRPSMIASRTSGRVARILAEEGQDVKEGDVIVLLDAAPNVMEAEALASQYRQAEARLQEVQNGPRVEEIRRQEAAVRELEAQFLRMANGPLPEEIRTAENRLALARAQLQKARSGARPQEIQAARAQEAQAEARLAAARRGPTAEEVAQLKAAVEAATARERNAKANWDRAKMLFDGGALSRQAAEAAETAFLTAEAARKQADEAHRRGTLGTPPEELRQAEQALRQARANRQLVEAGTRREDIEAAQQEANIAEENLRLIRRGSRSEDLAAMRARISQAQAVLAELRKGSREEEVAQARAAARAAGAQAESAKAVAGERVVKSTGPGQIDRVLVAVGDLLAAGTPVAVRSDPTDVWLRVYIPENELAKVNVGDSALLRIDGLEVDREAVVESISTRGEFTPANLQAPEERGKQVFAVRLRLKKPDPKIKAGMSATVKRIGSLG